MAEQGPRDPDGRARDDAHPELTGQAYCYLTTTGRRTGRPHTIEIWFALRGSTLYLLSGGRERSDWVRNLSETPDVTVRIGAERFSATARIVTDRNEDRTARDLLVSKYQPGSSDDLSDWRERALPVAIDLLTERP